MKKIEAKKYIQTLLLNQPGAKVDVSPVIHLLQKHPDYEDKITDIDCWVVRVDPIYKSKGLGIRKKNGDVIGFSYNHALSEGKTTYNSIINKTMRDIISPYIIWFRKKLPKICKCELCSCIAYDIHIDHVLCFKDIRDNWLKDKDIIDIIEDDNGLYSFEDYNLTLDWYNYHKDNAILRATCANCNMKRGYEKSS
jgi:hypothetical protein